jgi:AraC family transcriptional regulator
MDNFSYINKSVNDRDLLLYYINRAGSSEVKSDFYITRDNRYPYCVIHYVFKGSGHVIHKGRDYSIKQGDLFILNAYDGHSYFTDKENLLGLKWIEFGGADSLKLITAILKIGKPIISAPDSKKIDNYLHEIFEIIKGNEEEKGFLISKVIYLMLLDMLKVNKAKEKVSFSPSSLTNISKVIYYIENNLGESIDIEKLSGICCYSPTYFAKLFFKVMGNTPMNYVLGKRINKAKELLNASGISVERLSRVMGFSSPSHFIRSFKKQEGVTPAEFRKQSLMFKNKE